MADRTWSHSKLKTWIQRRCIVCEKFLNLEQLKYCRNCKPIKKSIRNIIAEKKYDGSHREQRRLYAKKHNHEQYLKRKKKVIVFGY